MSPSGCWGLSVALLALLFCPGSAEEFEVRIYPEQLVVEHGGSKVINCSTTCPKPNTGGMETNLNKTLLARETQWIQYEVFGVSQNTVLQCYFTCSQKQVSAHGNISVFYPPKEVLMTVQPIWVTVGESFIIECRVPAVAPLEKLTLTLLRGNESLHQQTFEGATAGPQEAMTTHNRTAHREDGRYNFSCQAELDLRSRGGTVIHKTSKSQGLEIHAVAPEAKRQLRGASSLEETETGLPRIVRLWSMASAMTATGIHCGSSGLQSSPG
ncbi:intercellular adhesion molecule 2 isoform X2 [Phyllostomus hastatus]|uniref:intercellular adhesion molecule 2 isoform X2 n=1 Tax=Phyllostomus hastatus TaxID=9423 RepID=UPI001E67EF58|nr:intercellular adhesion molecule 2 isoform X2 [Phyllostomus hastatus]